MNAGVWHDEGVLAVQLHGAAMFLPPGKPDWSYHAGRARQLQRLMDKDVVITGRGEIHLAEQVENTKRTWIQRPMQSVRGRQRQSLFFWSSCPICRKQNWTEQINRSLKMYFNITVWLHYHGSCVKKYLKCMLMAYVLQYCSKHKTLKALTRICDDSFIFYSWLKLG